MGLDVIELVMEVEEHFGISIPDSQAERIYTVGELYGYILKQMGLKPPGRKASIRCPTSRAFYQIRRTLTEELGVDRKAVRPAALLRDLFPADSRTAVWPRLSAALNLPNLSDADPPPRGPNLRSFKITFAVITGVAILLGALSSIVWLLDPARPPIGVFLVLFLLAWLGGSLVAFAVFGVAWLDGRYLNPVHVPNVRDLVFRLAARQDDLYPKADSGEPTPATVWSDLARIISDRADVPADQVRPEQRWIEDFE
jgi:acyl carrier protein